MENLDLKTKILYRTKLCTYYFSGKCKYGNSCLHAHSVENIRPLPDFRKIKLCQLFLKGACTDPNCSRAHGEQELRRINPFYRKKLCKYWVEKGYCNRGNDCYFAHTETNKDTRPLLDPLFDVIDSYVRAQEAASVSAASMVRLLQREAISSVPEFRQLYEQSAERTTPQLENGSTSGITVVRPEPEKGTTIAEVPIPLRLNSTSLASTSLPSNSLASTSVASTSLASTSLASTSLASTSLASTSLASTSLASTSLASTSPLLHGTLEYIARQYSEDETLYGLQSHESEKIDLLSEKLKQYFDDSSMRREVFSREMNRTTHSSFFSSGSPILSHSSTTSPSNSSDIFSTSTTVSPLVAPENQQYSINYPLSSPSLFSALIQKNAMTLPDINKKGIQFTGFQDPHNTPNHILLQRHKIKELAL